MGQLSLPGPWTVEDDIVRSCRVLLSVVDGFTGSHGLLNSFRTGFGLSQRLGWSEVILTVPESYGIECLPEAQLQR